MSKYYVQSGSVRCVVQAESSRKAALWAVHRVMQQVLPMEDSPEPVGGEPVSVLAGKVSVSERGFDREDASTMSTMEVVADWNQMIVTLDRLQQMLYRA